MRILTDCPEREKELAPISGWSVPGPHDIWRDEEVLWRVLAGERPPWIAVADTAGAVRFWERAMIIGDAPASQFELLSALSRGRFRLAGPIACLALQGRNFRGQRGRSWAAAPGNLHLTAALQPKAFSARHGIGLSMLPAVAVAEAVRDLTAGRIEAGIKWVNDIFVQGRKVAGVLTNTQVMADRITQIVLGIGLNLAQAPDLPRTPFVPAVGCLAAAGASVSLMSAFIAILDRLAHYYQGLERSGPEELLAAYRAFSIIIGREVCIWDDSTDQCVPGSAFPAPVARGVVVEICSDLSLRLDGVSEPVTRGRLAFAEHASLQDQP